MAEAMVASFCKHSGHCCWLAQGICCKGTFTLLSCALKDNCYEDTCQPSHDTSPLQTLNPQL